MTNPASNQLLQLPVEVHCIIASSLGVKGLLAMQQVCKTLQDIYSDDSLWNPQCFPGSLLSRQIHQELRRPINWKEKDQTWLEFMVKCVQSRPGLPGRDMQWMRDCISKSDDKEKAKWVEKHGVIYTIMPRRGFTMVFSGKQAFSYSDDMLADTFFQDGHHELCYYKIFECYLSEKNYARKFYLERSSEGRASRTLKMFQGTLGIPSIRKCLYTIWQRKDFLNRAYSVGIRELLTEYFDLGNLEQYLTMDQHPFSHEQLNFLLHDILCGLAKIHKKGYCHYNIQPSSILIGSSSDHDDFMRLRGALCGLGHVGKVGEHKRDIAENGYRAPEVISDIWYRYSTEADIWALGCTFWNFYFEDELPQFESFLNKRDDTLRMLKSHSHRPEPEKSTVQHILWRMTRYNPEERITAAEAYEAIQSVINLSTLDSDLTHMSVELDEIISDLHTYTNSSK